jgi:N-acetylmuramoyl-L-alanine amidase
MHWIEGLRGLAIGVVLAPLFAAAQTTPPPPPPPAPPPAQPSEVKTTQRFGVVIDAAHGGSDAGARLSDRLQEKDLVLTLSVRLRSTLSAHGIYVVTTRESDTAITA